MCVRGLLGLRCCVGRRLVCRGRSGLLVLVPVSGRRRVFVVRRRLVLVLVLVLVWRLVRVCVRRCWVCVRGLLGLRCCVVRRLVCRVRSGLRVLVLVRRGWRVRRRWFVWVLVR